MTISILIIVMCVLAEGFFSGSEIAIVNANRLKLSDMAASNHIGAKAAIKFIQKPELFLGATQIGTNLCTVTGTVTATILMINLFGSHGEIYAIITIWPLTLLFGEIIPKTVYQANADKISPYSALIIRIWVFALFPLIWILTRFSKWLINILKEKSSAEPTITRGDVKALAQIQDENGDIDIDEKRFIKRMIDFGSTKVSDVMVPLIDVVGMESDLSVEQAIQFANSHSYSRFPVYKDRVDQIVGIVDTYSLINVDPDTGRLRHAMRKPIFVPETMPVKLLLAELRHKSRQMAIVVDEYGGAVGIVTTEDVLEEVIGEINDEFDDTESLYRKIGPANYIFNARAEIEFINENFDIEIPDGDYETLGGYLLQLFNRIPKHDETISVAGIIFTVLNPTNRNLNEVRIELTGNKQES